MITIIEWFTAFVFWLIFVSGVGLDETLAGIAAAFLTVTILEALKRAEPLQFRPPLGALAQIWRVPALILRGNWTLVEELGRRLVGRRRRSAFSQTQFRAIGNGGQAAAKRALAVFFATLPPNFLIVGIDAASGTMLYHQIRKEPVPEIIHRLEAA